MARQRWLKVLNVLMSIVLIPLSMYGVWLYRTQHGIWYDSLFYFPLYVTPVVVCAVVGSYSTGVVLGSGAVMAGAASYMLSQLVNTREIVYWDAITVAAVGLGFPFASALLGVALSATALRVIRAWIRTER